MEKKSLDNLITEMDNLRRNFMNCRAFFPYTAKHMIGKKAISTAPYYIREGFFISLHFNEALTEESIAKINEVGHWINQNFIVRLCAMLESYHILSKTINIDKSINGWKELDLLKRLRDVFAHTAGKYRPQNKKQEKLVKALNSHFKLNINDPQDFPLSIDTVIEPMFEGCKRYVQGKYEGNVE